MGITRTAGLRLSVRKSSLGRDAAQQFVFEISKTTCADCLLIQAIPLLDCSYIERVSYSFACRSNDAELFAVTSCCTDWLLQAAGGNCYQTMQDFVEHLEP